MTEIVLHSEAFEELRTAFVDAGVLLFHEDAWMDDSFKVGEITYKLWTYVPTAEDIARQEAFYATPFGKMMREQMVRLAKKTADDLTRIDADYLFANGTKWPVGTTLKIRMPSDYLTKDHA